MKEKMIKIHTLLKMSLINIILGIITVYTTYFLQYFLLSCTYLKYKLIRRY